MLPDIIFIVIIVILAVLYLLERHHNLNASKSLEVEAEKKELNIIHQAMKKAQAIISVAEMESIKTTTDAKFNSKQIEEQIQTHFDQQFKQESTEIETAFKNYLAQLEKTSSDTETAMLDSTKQRFNEMLLKFEQTLSEFLSQTSEKSTTSIELEIRAARQLVETYKRQQLALIDENIVAMLEQTLSLVLSKKLSLKDETELIYEALEKAKIEKFII